MTVPRKKLLLYACCKKTHNTADKITYFIENFFSKSTGKSGFFNIN